MAATNARVQPDGVIIGKSVKNTGKRQLGSGALKTNHITALTPLNFCQRCATVNRCFWLPGKNFP